ILTYRNVLWSRLVRIEYWGDKVIPLNTFRTNPIDAIKAYLPPSNSSCQAFSAAHFPSKAREACRGQVSGKCCLNRSPPDRSIASHRSTLLCDKSYQVRIPFS